ncbi:phospho-sugar mutase [Fusobacterium ulcerans]|uniref:phospho-sugar mutase n=1 Tax=Fusobacterium ulcerans TaxID=861 RepID=UPI001D09B989|nr:phospho-sugar mutase [Fusobacterium ulcerans]MCB8566639.1 phospho-sugar mutase [Fusobacterium ulcerans]MCB8650867.1 phospho-sugar mutase [Fusobacterium ulcerans]
MDTKRYIIEQKYKKCLNSRYINKYEKTEIRELTKEEQKESFHKYLEFGTGGMRGIMGMGTNRMNIYMIRKATQGLSNYLIKLSGVIGKNKGVIIAYDCRINSYEFALNSALVLCANGIKTYLFSSLRSTPELSFAVRELGCHAGIMITASHNPKEYNGYKVYWEDGGQLVEPQASGIIEEVNKTDEFEDVKLITQEEAGNLGLLNILNDELDSKYLENVKKESILKDLPNKENFKLVYSPLHGTGGRPVKRLLNELGYKNVYIVEAQEKPDGEFPTCSYANPEEKNVFDLSIKLADEIGVKVCLSNDPDADRTGMMVKENNEWIYLNGNQIGMLLLKYILDNKKDIPKNGAVVTTIVSTPILDKIAKERNLKVFRTLTGFKYIGEKIREFEEGKYDNSFVFGMEESIGYLKGTYVRDKDGILGVMLLTEMAAYFESIGTSPVKELEKLYDRYGWYSEITYPVKREGIQGTEEIKRMMEELRKRDLKVLLNKKINIVRDYKLKKEKNYLNDSESELFLPESDVVQYILEDETYITVRPSGTEPKIKYYIYTKGKSKRESDEKLENILNNLKEYMESLLN